MDIISDSLIYIKFSLPSEFFMKQKRILLVVTLYIGYLAY